MSWILPTTLILLAGFTCIWFFGEWLVRPRKSSGGNDDDPSMAG